MCSDAPRWESVLVRVSPPADAASEGRRAGNAEQRTGSGRMCEDKRGGLHVHA